MAGGSSFAEDIPVEDPGEAARHAVAGWQCHRCDKAVDVALRRLVCPQDNHRFCAMCRILNPYGENIGLPGDPRRLPEARGDVVERPLVEWRRARVVLTDCRPEEMR